MPERFWGRRKKRFEQQDSSDPDGDSSRRRRFQPFKKMRERLRNMMAKLLDAATKFLPSWLVSYGLQFLLLFIGAPWWVWPIVAIALMAFFGGWFG